MQDAIDKFKTKLFFFSFGLGLASTVAIFQPNELIKNVGKGLLGFSFAGIAIGEVVSSKVASEINNASKITDDVANQLKYEVSAVTKNLDKTINDLATTKKDSERLENELQQALEFLQTRNTEVFNANKAIQELQNKLKDVGRFSTDEAYKLVRATYNRSVRKLEAHIEALMRNYPLIADELNNVLIEVDKFKSRWNLKIDTYETINNFDELLDTGLDFQQKIIEGCIELRVKGQTIAIRYLDSLLENTIDFGEAQQVVTDLQQHAGKTIQQLKGENEAQVRAVVSDWVAANNHHIENYETNYTELIESGKQAIAALQQRDVLISEIQGELDQLRKPWTFTGSIDYAVAGNAIINFYHRAYGYVLDAMVWAENETGYTLTFATSRNKTYLTADMLEDKDNLPQLAGLTNSLQLPKFTPNYQSGLMTLEVVTRKATKKLPIEKLEADINKIWVSADKFESFVKKFERVRITAGSTGGKSPTAKNVALAIMSGRKGKGKIKLYDPQHGSKKDFWNMPKSGTSHEDNLKGMRELCELIDSRRGKSGNEFILYVFDECDNTVSNLGKESNQFKNYLKIAIKEGSHADIGAIFIGQSADANEVPGMTHSNWNNAVQIHIGSNAGVCLDKLTTVTTEEKTRLLEQYRKIQEYCDTKNDDLGLDIFTDASAYRFALVVPLTGLPKFIQLPDFDSYDYNDVMTELQNPELTEPQIDSVRVSCPHCASSNIRKNGKNSKGDQYFQCNDCDSKPKRWIN
jgi:InsA N-terminal domain